MSSPAATLRPACKPALRRGLRTAALALLLGALSNYAVVWWIILTTTPSSLFPVNHLVAREAEPDFTFVADGVAYESTVEKSTIGVECAVWALPDSVGANSTEPKPLDRPSPWMIIPASLSADDQTGSRGSFSVTWTTAYGFPAICLMYTEAQLFDTAGAVRLRKENFWSFDVDLANATRRLPLKPVWKGFLANAAIFAVLWLGVILLLRYCGAGLRATLVWIERRIEANTRGKCRKCGYSRAGLPSDFAPCPECGDRQI